MRSVKAIRKAMDSQAQIVMEHVPAQTEHNTALAQLGRTMLHVYGQEAIHQIDQISQVLRRGQADRSAHAAAQTLSVLSGRADPTMPSNGHLTPEADPFLSISMGHQDLRNAFTAVFEDDTLSSSWMMQDWLDEIQM